MKKFPLLLILTMLFLNHIANAQEAKISDKKLNILTLGDSNGTFPYSWPQQLKTALPNAQIFNISKSGRTIGFLNLGDSSLNSLMVIGDNLKKAADHTADKSYDFIVIDLGTNDGKAIFAQRQGEVAINFEKLIKTIQGSSFPVITHAKIVIISPTPYGTKAEQTEKYAGGGARVIAMAKAFKLIADKNHCLFVNGQQITGLDIETMTADGLHLDATASRKLIEPVVNLILKN